VYGGWVQFHRAYLTAYLFFLGIALGSSTILMLYHITGGAWGFLIRRILEAGMRTLPLLAVLFTPVACGFAFLGPVARSPLFVGGEVRSRELYFDPRFFWARVVIYFSCWLGIAYLMSTWSRRQDQTGDADLPRRLARFSGISAVIYAVTITFASIDWVMSLQPEFRSTIFGPLFASGQILSGQAVALIVLVWVVQNPGPADFVSSDVLNDLGNMLLTFLVVWGYLAYFQLMLIWIGNLPYEISWYLLRSRGGWQWVAWALFVFHFAIPFVFLLMRNVKQKLPALASVAALILFMQLVYMYFQVMPVFEEAGLGEHWMDVLMPVALGGPWLAYFLWQLSRLPLIPLHDPNRETAVHIQRYCALEDARREEVNNA
jgi:hypothetical protein